ncbi:MAG: GxxExxY protein [Gammaproteobacteria bacterium]
MKINGLTREIIAAAIEVHDTLGPGLLESTYEVCLASELVERGFQIERQKALPVMYKNKYLEAGYRIDLLVQHEVIVEIKSVHSLEAIHEAQLLSYLKLSGYRVGLLVNFNVKLLKNGIRRLVNELPE